MSNGGTVCHSASTRSSQISVRKQRIERWIQKDPLENSFSQSNRLLRMGLLRLGDQREKLIERHNYNQKLFVNKQAIRYKDNESILNTLNYVRKCCHYFDMTDIAEESIDPQKLLEENQINRLARTPSANENNTLKIKRNLAQQTNKQLNSSLTEVFLRHNKKHIQKPSTTIEATENDGNQDRHVQFQLNNRRNIQSALVSKKTTSPIDKNKQSDRNVTSAYGLRTYQIASPDSVPIMTTVDQMEE
ncbi:unnamed protein product, partial [Adineta ricciae]